MTRCSNGLCLVYRYISVESYWNILKFSIWQVQFQQNEKFIYMENKPKPLLNSVTHGSNASRKRKQALSLNKVCLVILNSCIKLWVNKVSFEVSHYWLAIRKSHGAVGWENVYYTSQKLTNAGNFKTCIKKMKENPCFLRTPRFKSA